MKEFKFITFEAMVKWLKDRNPKQVSYIYKDQQYVVAVPVDCL